MHPGNHMIGLGCLLYCLASPVFAHPDYSYAHEADDDFTDKSSWMKSIRDEVKLSELALPGTHDSATFDVNLYPVVDDIVSTQTLNFDQQLKYGIRVFDLRIRRTSHSFALHHGPVFLDKMFGSALGSIEAFLQANPTETVLFRLKEEHSANTNVTQSLAQIFDSYMQRYASVYLKSPRNTVTLGEARGKFIVLSNISSLNPYGLNYANFDIQDDYSLTTNWELHEKYLKVRRQLLRAASCCCGKFGHLLRELPVGQWRFLSLLRCQWACFIGHRCSQAVHRAGRLRRWRLVPAFSSDNLFPWHVHYLLRGHQYACA